MNDNERLTLKKMIRENDVVDQTENIRKLKHSDIIKENVQQLLYTKSKYARLEKTNQALFDTMCIKSASFLYEKYTDLYNKIKKDKLNLDILNKFISVLKQIENNEIDQHEGSFLVGKLLKELYIDSAIHNSSKTDETTNKHTNKRTNKHKKKNINNDNTNDINSHNSERQISWSTYKAQNLRT